MTDHTAPAQAEISDAVVPRKVRSRLFLKYAGLFVAVVCLALVTNGVFEIWVSYREHKDALIQIQHEQAESAAAKIGQFIKEIESQVGWTTQLLWSAGTIEQRRFDALRLLRQVPAITELAQVDASGKEQLRVSRLAMDVVGSGLDLSKEPKFTDAVKSKVYYGPVYFRRDSEPYMTLSLAGTRRDAGVSIAEVNLKLIWDVVSKIKVGQHGQAYVVDAQGRLIAHPDISLVLRKTDMTRLAQVQAARRSQAGAEAQDIETATDIQGRQVLTAYAPVAPLGWTVFVELPVDEAYQPLITSIQRTALVLFGALLLAALAGIFLARRMMVPIQALRAGAARIGGGDLSQRISVKTGDELEALADQFNDMTGRLQESYADLEQKVEVRTAELSESLDQQTATSEVLRVISSSPGDLQPVFEAMLENAVRICEAKFGNLFLYEKNSFRIVAQQNPPPAYAERWRQEPVLLVDDNSQNPLTTLAATRDVVHIADLATEPGYVKREPRMVSLVESAGARTHLLVPMLKEGELIGAISIYRQEVRPFGDKQIEVVQNFAAQAVIAIENTRLLKELRQRTDDLSESLEQQTATSEVLKVISSSSGELQPVFEAMLENATRLCAAKFGNLYLREGDAFRTTAMHNVPPAFAEARRREPVIHPRPGSLLGRVTSTMRAVHIPEVTADQGYIERHPLFVSAVELGGFRALLAVPMLKDGNLIGAIVIYRQEPGSFTDKQIELVKNFAAQAVIAIENARLLNELRETLERQTATSEVLSVISSSPGELQPVFDTMLAKATELCEASYGTMWLREGDAFRTAALHGALPAAYLEEMRSGTLFRPGPDVTLARVAQSRMPIQVADLRESRGYLDGDRLPVVAVDGAGIRTMVVVPMLKENELVGAISIYRREVRPFTDKQIELVSNFAAQAVIAIENTRLLKELRQRTDDLSESLEQQTATAEVLQVISSSPGELEPVFQTMLANAVRICDAKFGVMFRYDGDAFYPAAFFDAPPALAEYIQKRRAFQPLAGTNLDRMWRTKDVVRITDDSAEPVPSPAAKFGGARSLIAVPMLKEDTLIGGIVIYRQEVRPFTDKQIELVSNFAAQAVIAVENTRLLSELRESLQQQTATSEVLEVISSSPGELEPVFNAMLKNATRICEAKLGSLFLYEADSFRAVAVHGDSFYADWSRREPDVDMRDSLHKGTPLERLTRTKAILHIPDLRADEGYLSGNPRVKALVESAGARTHLVVPMLKDDELVGAIVIYRQEVRPFSDKQIELITNFAKQAVIAIENTRLLKELRQRTDDLSESLQQQTATSEVLRVISSSPGELEPVFQAMLANATRICGAKFGVLHRYKNGAFYPAAWVSVPQALAEFYRQLGSFQPPAGSPLDRLLQAGGPIYTADETAESNSSPARLGGARSLVAVPMRKDNELVGAIVIYRQEVLPFSDKQVALLTSFAAQAVIAIENARLLNELHQRTDDLTESLQQQTATSDILQVISNSPTDSQPAFDAIVRSGLKLFPDAAIMIALPDGDVVRGAAIADADPAGVEALRARLPLPLSGEFITSRAILDRREIDIPDATDSPKELAAGARNFLASGYRAISVMPMMRGESAIGTLNVMRRHPGPLSDKQRELLRTFASQAVIAIENTRLFKELRERTDDLSESLQQQTATAEVLKVISGSAFDLQPVLDTIVETAARLCDAEFAVIFRLQGDKYHCVADNNAEDAFLKHASENPIAAERGSLIGRTALEQRTIHLPDCLADPEYTYLEYQSLGNYRSMLGVPLLREGTPIGVIGLMRTVVMPFTEKQIELVTTFADQAVIAIENVRLFDEIQDKSRQLAEASKHKSQFLANMSHELRTPMNAILGYTELIMDNIYGEPTEKMRGVLTRVQSNGKHLLGLINDVLDLSKIEAGQLTLSLADYSVKDIVHSVFSSVESLAKNKKLELKVELPKTLPAAHGDERRLTQVLLNLVGNSIKFTDKGEVAIRAEAANGSFTISVRDTGPGIAIEDQHKIFEEFQQADSSTTKEKGGTGLGLAISKRIVEMHGGRLWVDSSLGHGSTFSFNVPLKVERQVEPA